MFVQAQSLVLLRFERKMPFNKNRRECRVVRWTLIDGTRTDRQDPGGMFGHFRRSEVTVSETPKGSTENGSGPGCCFSQ